MIHEANFRQCFRGAAQPLYLGCLVQYVLSYCRVYLASFFTDNLHFSALLYYDYALTVTGEITHFWWYGSTSIVSILFFLNRYFTMFGQIPIALDLFGDIPEEVVFFHHLC